MSNSPLVSYTRLSPNRTKPRKHPIDTVTIHCMAGNLKVETCGNIFAAEDGASSNYGVGSDGRVALYVDEANRSWCSSSPANDHRAVTIEVANDGGAPDWHVSDKALASLINLVADICRRNDIKRLLWRGDKNLIGQPDKQNMTVHRWFANKACPGNYLYNLHPSIADEVNKLLGTEDTEPEAVPAPPASGVPYQVRVTATSLNIRSTPSTGGIIRGAINDRGVYTIVEEAAGMGSAKWGKLKSGAGWISLGYTTRI